MIHTILNILELLLQYQLEIDEEIKAISNRGNPENIIHVNEELEKKKLVLKELIKSEINKAFEK